jgi:hypothetical protein
MAMETWSKFYYGYEVTSSNNKLNFNEGALELTATLTVGIYSPSDLAVEVKTALDAAGAKTYTVTFNRSTRKFTINCGAGTYTLLVATGSNLATTAFTLLGFTGADLAGLIAYTSNLSSGSEYKVQFKLQDYTAPTEWYEKIDPSVNESASGHVEIVSFGTVQFTEFNMMFITNKSMDGVVIRNNQTGVSVANSFMQFIIKRGKFDFMPDENDPATYYKLTLESTPSSSKGVGYKLQEETSKSLPGFYQTGKLKFRVVS